MEKKTYDMRGRLSNLDRLARFDIEAWIHMWFYRWLIFYSVIYGIVMLASFAYPALSPYIKPMTVILWILFTPQVFETAKGFSLIATKGLAFGHLSEEYTSLVKVKYKRGPSVFPLVTYGAFAIWLAGFVAMLLWWTI